VAGYCYLYFWKMDEKRNTESFNKMVRREMEVAFSKKAQPVWFRILKYILLGCILYFFWGALSTI
jgi:hypothetical protein